MSSIGKRIYTARKHKGLTQPELARRCGWESQSRVSMYERDKREPGFADLKRIAGALDQPLSYFVSDNEAEKPPTQTIAPGGIAPPVNRGLLIQSIQDVLEAAPKRSRRGGPSVTDIAETIALVYEDYLAEQRQHRARRRDAATILRLVSSR